VTQDGSPAEGLVEKAIPLLEQRQRALDKANAYNKVSVQLSERTELDLVVLRQYLDSQEHPTRLEAVSAAGELEWKESQPFLLALLEREPHPFVISKLTKVIGSFGDDRVLDVLSKFLSHADDRVRANTIEGVEALPGEAKFTHLMPKLEDPSPRVRANALKALQALGGDKFTSLLERMVHSGESAQRLSVTYALGAIRGPEGQKHLARLLEDDDRDVQERAMAQLARRGDMSSAHALIAFMQTECGERARGRALTALRFLRSRAAPDLASKLDGMIQGLVGELGEMRGAAIPAAQDVATLLNQLAELSKPQAPPEPEPPPPPPPSSAEAEDSKEDEAAAKAALEEEKVKKTLARMNAALSALEPRERRAVEKMVRTGKVQNDSQLPGPTGGSATVGEAGGSPAGGSAPPGPPHPARPGPRPVAA
jgi:HEAT repeat protein